MAWSRVSWPRFYLQILSLAEMAIGRDEFHQKAELYQNEVIPEIKNFYDLYHSLQELIVDYKTGMANGKYYYRNAQGTPIFQTHNERKILNTLKDFIMRGKTLLIHFMDCKIIDESNFVIEDFVKVRESKKFDERKAKYLASSDQRYLPIIID